MPTKRERMFMEAAEQKASQVGLGRAVIRLREETGMSRAEFSRRAGVAGNTIGGVEMGEIEAKWGTLRGIAKGLDVGLDSLLRLGIELAPGQAGERLRQREREARDVDSVARERDEDQDEGVS